MSSTEKFYAGGYLPASFLDWGGHVAAVVFTSGCNFCCPWCHNSNLVLRNTERIPLSVIIEDLIRRHKFLDGVVISGGEPCIWEGLIPFMRELKTLGLPVKLDTNGSIPEVLFEVFNEQLAAYIAMDIKAPLDAVSLKRLTGVDVSVECIRKSIALIRNEAPSYEFRTTYIEQLLTMEDLLLIRRELNCDPNWILQCFRPTDCLDPKYCSYPPVDPERVRKLFPDVSVRG